MNSAKAALTWHCILELQNTWNICYKPWLQYVTHVHTQDMATMYGKSNSVHITLVDQTS